MRTRLPLLAILGFAAGLRLLYITQPYIEAHRWRQVDTAAIARNFYENGLDLLHPQIDWGGSRGAVEAEFPLLPGMVAVEYHLFGDRPWVGRVTVVVFGVALVWATFQLALALGTSPAAGLAAAFLVASSPSAAFYARTMMPDTPMLFFMVMALAGFVRYAREQSARGLAIGSVMLALGCLTKIPAVLVLAPIGVALLTYRGLRVFADKRVWLALAVPLVLTIAWYWHADRLYHRTGLTFGILFHPAKTYPAWIKEGPWPYVFSKWSTREMLADPDFYLRMLSRLYYFHLAPIGLTCSLIGAWFWNSPGRRVIGAWLAVMVLFVLVAGEVHRSHDYYQLPFVVIAAIPFGVLAGPLFDRDWLRAHLGSARWQLAGLAVTLACAAVMSFYYSGVTQSHFRTQQLDVRLLNAGTAVDSVTDDNALAIVLDDYGITSPLLLYFAHLKGWSFDTKDLSPALVERLRHLGARYFVTTRWNELVSVRPDVAAQLERYRAVDLPPAPGDMKVFRLQ